MKFRPYNVERAPKALPIWHAILEDLGNPPAARVAKALGLTKRTVYRYNATGHAPRPVMLALFWLTRWGHSQVDAEAVNNCQMAIGLADCLHREVQELRAQVQHLLSIGDYGAANAPLGVSASPRTHHAAQLRAPAPEQSQEVHNVAAR